MSDWLASPYRAVGIYIGGVNRACAQVNLTAPWLAGIAAQGWRYFPIYPGLQSSCVLASGDATITTNRAAAEGSAAADDAAARAAALGIPPRTPLSYDMEAYGPACNGQVLAFLSAWDSELHARGYRAGVYESFTNIGALAGGAGSITEPDVIYYADWDENPTTASPYLPSGLWTGHARIHQYRGGHVETYGGAAIDIDTDALDVDLGGGQGPACCDGFRISVAINANGTAEWFARSAAGRLVHAWQHPVGSLSWSPMHVLGRSPATIAGNPAAVRQSGGALTVFALDDSGQLDHAWQRAGFPDGWEWGKPLPPPPGAAMAGTDPAALLLPRGDVAVYQTLASGAVAVTAQWRPDGNARWVPWGIIGGSCASTPVPVVDSARKVEVLCLTTAGSAAMIRWSGSSWGQWQTLPGGPDDLAGAPAAIVNGAGQTELFAATTTGGIGYAWQDGDDGSWTWADSLAAGATVGGPVSAATWPAGRVVVYASLSDGAIGFVRQLGTAGPDPWTGLAQTQALPGNAVLGSPAGWLNTGGAAGLAALDGERGLAVASDSGTGWSSWTTAGTGF